MHTFSFPHRVAELARQVESWGFAGMQVGDSQSLNADVWMELALAAAATERIALGPGVTNPVTRHLAVTASCAATLQAESGGRAVLGIGRGDTALTQIGRRPVSPPELERALVALQGYLRGEDVALDGARSRIGWIGAEGEPKVPVSVAASGPRVIEVAARHADRIDLAVGAEPDRLRVAIEQARRASEGREPSLGAFLNVAVHRDRAVARDLIRGSAGILAMFAAPRAASLDDDFIDRFALAGPPDRVLEQLAELARMGVNRLLMMPGTLNADPEAVAESNAMFAEEVLPELSRLAA
jgi:5,10-methylenetetrahydromethanopterin reductase